MLADAPPDTYTHAPAPARIPPPAHHLAARTHTPAALPADAHNLEYTEVPRRLVHTQAEHMHPLLPHPSVQTATAPVAFRHNADTRAR